MCTGYNNGIWGSLKNEMLGSLFCGYAKESIGLILAGHRRPCLFNFSEA
jgi:hypothetical protein